MVNASNICSELTLSDSLEKVIAKYEQAKIEVVTELSETERGTGGFGSTGK